MNEKNFDFKEYREQLASRIKKESDKEKRREILEKEKQTPEYQRAKELHQKEREKFLEGEEEILPVLKHAREIKEVILKNETAIIVGETGSGKTTQIPLILKDAIPEDEKIIITQPRRVAARSVAKYVAQKAGCRVGEEVGYQVRFDDHTTEGTRINFVTDGIILRKIQEDPLLREYSVVMVDEAHERSLNIDFTLGLLKRLQQERERKNLPPLKIVVTSATLEKEKFSQYFENSPLVEVPGRTYPVKIYYEKEPVYDYPHAAAEKVREIIESKKMGDILIFMPGQEEIERTIKEIEELHLSEVVLLPLYGQMSPENQDKIFQKFPGKRKVIVATNIAETSVTVPGIKHVIDSGLIKQIEYNPSSGVEALAVRPHAKSGCVQRAGRAGRTSPGECWRLYTKEQFERRQEFQTPEIQRSNLAHVVLMMKKIGIEDVKSFDFIDPPSEKALNKAIETLNALGALDENENLTEIGEIMAELPLEPKLARMVIEAEKHNCVETVCTIAAFLGTRSVFVRPRNKQEEADMAHSRFKNPWSDFLTLLNVWNEYENNRYKENWARENFLNSRVLNEVKQIRYQLFRALKRNGIRASESRDPNAIGKAITAGLIENLMAHDYGFSYYRVSSQKGGFYIHPSSGTFESRPPFIVASQIIETTKPYARVVQKVEPEWIVEVAPHFTEKSQPSLYYNKFEDKVVQEVKFSLKYFKAPLKTERKDVSTQEAVKIFAEALVNGEVYSLDLSFNKSNWKTIDVFNDLWRRSEGKIREKYFSREDLINFYTERLGSIASVKELQKALEENRVNLILDLDDLVSPQEREEILQKNPDTIEILEKPRSISYEYNSTRENKFNALVKLSPEEIIKLSEIPVLPSGRAITLKTEIEYNIFSSDNLSELKEKIRKPLIKKQWEEWKREHQDIYKKKLEKLNPLEPLPELPSPLQFGTDPLTNEPLFAYPAITLERDYYGKPVYEIRYFPSQEEASQAQEKVLETLKKEKNLVLCEKLAEEIETTISEIRKNFSDYDSSRVWEIEEKFKNLKWSIESNPEKTLEDLSEVQKELQEIIDKEIAKKLYYEKVNEAVEKYFAKCPLCGSKLERGKCPNENHNIDRVKFNLDEEGELDYSTTLYRIVDSHNKDRMAAQLYVTNFGLVDTFINEVQYFFSEGEFSQEIVKKLSFELEDLHNILPPESAKKNKERIELLQKQKQLERAQIDYQESLDFAREQVENGFWKKGKFERGRHPKTGEEQWEINFRKSGKLVKYLVDRWGDQPSSEDLEYFFETTRTLVDTPKFCLILVRLQPPFPEYKPDPKELREIKEKLKVLERGLKEKKGISESDSENIVSEEDSKSEENPKEESESFEEAIKKLKEKWGSR